MKQFKFNLDSVLKYRENIEDNEKNILAGHNAVLARLRGDLNALRGELLKAASEFEERCLQGMLASDIVSSQAYIKSIENSIKNKLSEIRTQEKAVEAQTTVVVKATQDVKTLTRLKENRYKEYTAKDQKAQELYIEEFVSYQKSASTI